jgi:Glu-tRNA(Gln) amidotransferase subunit E-like FAD-binding protein
MEMLNLLNRLYLEARKNGNSVGKSCLGTMKGEVENALKSSNETPTVLIQKYCLKSKKNLLEFKPEGYEAELEILNNFLPSQLEDNQVRCIISQFLSDENKEAVKSNFGFVMGKLSKELKGKVDPSKLKSLIEEKLA